MFRSSLRILTSFVVMAAAPLAVFFMRSSNVPLAAALSGERRQQGNGGAPKGPNPGKIEASKGHPSQPGVVQQPNRNNQGRSGGDTKLPPEDPEDRGRAAGGDELNRSIAGFCDEYAEAPSKDAPKCPETSGRKLYVAIAILPDPVHTHLALRFDRGIDDIEDAMQDLKWTFDHSWLPWDKKVYPATDRYEDREQDSAEQRGREQNPGVLMFRGPDVEQPQSELVVLVVGDTPTAGVNPGQFKQAMKWWRSLAGTKTADPKELAILGPTFTGSVQSLRHLLVKDLGGTEQGNTTDCRTYTPPHVDIASGTVSSGDRMAGLEAITDYCGHLVASDVASFGIDLSYQSSQLAHFLLKHIPGERIVRLSEAESSFGERFASPATLENLYGMIEKSSCATNAADCTAQRATQEFKVLGGTRQQSERNQEAGKPEFAIPMLHFPREISNLRKAYEENSIVGFGSTSNSPRTQLSFSGAVDTHDDDDTVATFSGEQSTLAMETEMSLIAAKLSSDRDDVVLLSATDMLDEIFVARYLQQHAPKVTVIIEDADETFLRSGEDAGLSDFYVASPWPLIEENLEWSGSGDPEQPHLFQSQSDEGLHNAAISLMCGQLAGQCGPAPAPLYDYRPPLLPPGVGWPETARPPLWLSVIGHGQFTPIALVDVDQTDAGLPEAGALNLPPVSQQAVRAAAGIDVTTVIPAVKLAMAMIAVLLVWHGLAFWWARLDRQFAWTYALAEQEHFPCRLLLQALVSVSALPALSLLWIPWIAGLSEQHGGFRWCLIGLQALAVVLATWPALRWFCGKVPSLSCEQVLWRTSGVLAGVAALAWLVDNFLWRAFAPPEFTERLFFLYRNTQLLSGSSPALTLGLLLGAIVFWLHSHFGRLAFFGHRIPVLPSGHEDAYCPSAKMLRPLTDMLTIEVPLLGWLKPRDPDAGPHWKARLTLLAMVVVGLTLLLAGTWGPRSLARSRFDVWVWALTYVVAVLIVRDVAIAFCGWRFLERLCLQVLKRSHLRWGFSWIKGFSWRRIWTSYRAMSPEVMFDYMMRMKESNQRVGGDKKLQLEYAALRNDFYKPAGKRNGAWANQVAQDILKVHVELARVASDKLRGLEWDWGTDRGAVTGPELQRGVHDESPISELKGGERKAALVRMADEEFAALLYLGYIRMVLVQIRNRIVTASVTYVLLLWALTSYPWMNRHAILISLCLLLAVISAATVSIYAEMHRDDILSRTTETVSGKLDADFFGKVIPTIGIPLLTLVATQFPALSNFIFSWVEPGLKGP